MDPLLLTALITAGSQLFAGGMQNMAIGEQEKKSLDLSMLARADQRKDADRSYGLAKENLGLSKTKFNYDKALNRENENKKQISLFGNTLSRLFKNNADSQSWIMSLYGAPAKGMG